MNLAVVYPLKPALAGGGPRSRQERFGERYQAIVDGAAAGGNVDEDLVHQAMTARVSGVLPAAQLQMEILRAGAGPIVFIVVELVSTAAPALARAALSAACQAILADPARFGLSTASLTIALADWKEPTDD